MPTGIEYNNNNLNLVYGPATALVPRFNQEDMLPRCRPRPAGNPKKAASDETATVRPRRATPEVTRKNC